MPSALFPVAVGPTMATSRGTSDGRAGARAHQRERDQRRQHEEQPGQLRPARQRHGASGFSLKKKVTVKNALLSGYSGGSASVGFEARMALRADSVKASTADGLATV